MGKNLAAELQLRSCMPNKADAQTDYRRLKKSFTRRCSRKAVLYLLQHEVMQARATRPSLRAFVQYTRLLLHLQSFWGKLSKM